MILVCISDSLPQYQRHIHSRPLNKYHHQTDQEHQRFARVGARFRQRTQEHTLWMVGEILPDP